MYRRAVACALIACALPAYLVAASQRDPVVEAGTMDSGMPPLRYQGDAATIVIFTDRAGIEENCGKAQKGFVIIACHRQLKDSGASVLFMPNPCIIGDKEFYARIACHEKGHVLGWGGEHEP